MIKDLTIQGWKKRQEEEERKAEKEQQRQVAIAALNAVVAICEYEADRIKKRRRFKFW